MQTLYDIETRTMVLARSMNVRRHAVYILRDGKTVKTLESDNDPFRISVSNSGLLAAGEKRTQIWNLRAKKLMKPLKVIEGNWMFGAGTDLLFSICRTPSSGGLFVRGLEESEPRLVCADLKGNPSGLYPGAEWWFFADSKNKQCVFGREGAIVSKAAWNSGALGDFPEAFEVDFPGKRVFARHTFYKFGCISRIVMGESAISTYKTDSDVLSAPVLRNGQWFFALASQGAARIHLLNPETMADEGPINPAPLPLKRKMDLLDLGDGTLGLATDQASFPLFWQPEEGREAKPLSIDKVEPALLADYGRWSKDLPEDLPGSYTGFLPELADAQWASRDDVLHFGIHGLFRLREHEFIALIPDWRKEFADWPVVRCEEEYDFSLLAVLDPRGGEFKRFTDPGCELGAQEAWKIITEPWPAFLPEPQALCQKIIDAAHRQEHWLFAYIEAMSEGTAENFYQKLIEAAGEAENQGDQGLAIALSHNSQFGQPLEGWEGQAKNILLRSAGKKASASYKAWLGSLISK